MMDGLAFLPPDYTSNGMNYLKEIVPQEVEELLTYFDQTSVYLRHSASNHRMVNTCNKARFRTLNSQVLPLKPPAV